MKRNGITLVLILFTGLLSAQTGPGGVGNSTSVAMWLAADGGAFTDAGVTQATESQGVQQWNDISGNNRHATQATSGNRPLFRNNVANNKPGLRFTGNHFIDGPALGIANTSSYTYLITFRDTTTGLGNMNDGNGHFILDRTTATNELVSLKPITGNFYGYQKRNNSGGGLGGPLSTSNIDASTKIIQMRRDFNVSYHLFYNAVQQATLADADGATTPPPPRIGRHATTANNGIRGYINEFIIYSTALNTAQTIIVNNYLAAKYGLALGGSDIYVQDDAGNGNYDHEVAGIGQVDASNTHSDAKGTGIVRILNPGGLGNNEFYIWGHDNGLAYASNNTDVPAGVQSRFGRVWRGSEVNAAGGAVDVGSIDMRWDLNNLGAVTATDVVLLVDTDNDGLFADETPVTNPTNLGSGIYEFSGVTAITNGLRFTIGTRNSTQTPLPVEITHFEALVVKNTYVKLFWKTAVEINNDYYTIERSKDGEHWEKIDDLKGAGSSSTKKEYTLNDEQPFEGTSYYRLKQTDFDGQYKYFGIREVTIFGNNLFTVYPVPSEAILVVKGKNLPAANLVIYNANGLSQPVRILNESLDEITLEIKDLPSGMYFISNGRNVLRFVRK